MRRDTGSAVRPEVCPCRGTAAAASGAGGLPHAAQSGPAALADSLYLFTRDHQTVPRQAEALPWKLEYSAYDRRWWVILYDPGQSRTIKARLDNLEEIRLLGPSGVEDGEVEAAMDRLLEPEPVVLEVRRTRGTLERCFLVLENQLFERTRQVSEDCFYVSFRYYRFDRSEILRRLLYLGPGVRLISPPDLREALVALLDQALEA